MDFGYDCLVFFTYICRSINDYVSSKYIIQFLCIAFFSCTGASLDKISPSIVLHFSYVNTKNSFRLKAKPYPPESTLPPSLASTALPLQSKRCPCCCCWSATSWTLPRPVARGDICGLLDQVANLRCHSLPCRWPLEATLSRNQRCLYLTCRCP